MLNMEKLVEETVVHKSFGTGVVRGADDKYLEVEFPEKNKKSTFVYPLCFDGFLMLVNEEKQAEVLRELKQWKIEGKIVQKEELWHRYEKTTQEIRARQMAAEEKKRKSAQRTMENRSAYSGIRKD